MKKGIKVLDRGFVRLVDFMGGDGAVVQAARVSYGGGSKGEEKDRELINYLMKHGHETPFEMSVFKFHVKCPIFVMRQWIRHRIASYNEISGRYTEFQDGEMHVPDSLRIQDTQNRQGSCGDFGGVDSKPFVESIDLHNQRSWELYQSMLRAGVAREQARMVLPLSLYTEFYWTINVRSLMNFLKLRTDSHAQKEIRDYANIILGMFKEKMPWSHEAFVKHYLKGGEYDSSRAVVTESKGSSEKV